jgi:hypothetical protein
MRHRVLLFAFMFVVVLALAVSCAAEPVRPVVAPAERCEVDEPTPSPSPTASESPEVPLTLTAKATGFFFDLANNRKEQVRTIDVEASRSLAPDQRLCVTTIGDLLTSDAHGALERTSMSVAATIDPRNPRLIQVTVTLTPKDDPRLGAFRSGSYSGTIRLAGVGLEKVDIPIQVTLRSGTQVWGPLLAALAILLGLGVGSLARWYSKQGQAASERNQELKAQANLQQRGVRRVLNLNWWRTTGVRFVLGVATAIGVAAVGWSTQFLDKPTFGTAGFTDWLALTLWGFAAGYAGKTIADYTPATAPPPNPSPPQA